MFQLPCLHRGVLAAVQCRDARQNVQIVDDGTTAQIEEVLAAATIAGARSLPLADVRQRVRERYGVELEEEVIVWKES